MVLEVLSNSGDVSNKGNSKTGQFSSGTNSRKLEELRSSESSGRDDDFIVDSRRYGSSLPVILVGNAGGLFDSVDLSESYLQGQGSRSNVEVVSDSHPWFNVSIVGDDSFSVVRIDGVLMVTNNVIAEPVVPVGSKSEGMVVSLSKS
jgi:hypothetical protein